MVLIGRRSAGSFRKVVGPQPSRHAGGSAACRSGPARGGGAHGSIRSTAGRGSAVPARGRCDNVTDLWHMMPEQCGMTGAAGGRRRRGRDPVQQNVAALDVTLTADQLAVLDPPASQVTGTRY